MRQHVLACKEAQAHVSTVYLKLQTHITGEDATKTGSLKTCSVASMCTYHSQAGLDLHPHVFKLAGKILIVTASRIEAEEKRHTIGISYAVEVWHWLALGVQNLHLLIHRNKATPVSLHSQGA